MHLTQGFLNALRPAPRITVSQWADENRYLSAVAAAESGKFRTERTPYLREIMDNLSDMADVEQIVFMKGAQVGATEMGMNWLGAIIDLWPGPAMYIAPTEDMAKRNSKLRVETMVQHSPNLRAKVADAKKRDSGNTMLQKNFPGGVLVMAGANSGSALRSMPVKYLFLDEVDAYPSDVDGEGSPLELAIARTRTFAKRKIFIVSTPVTQGLSPVENRFLESSQKYFFVPCVHCKEKQVIKFENLKWEKGKPETVKLFCTYCGGALEEKHKPYMLANGEWRDTATATNPRKLGYHLSSLYSPLGWFSWAEIVDTYEKAENDTPKMKVFVNTILGESYVEKGEVPDWQGLYNRRETYDFNTIPQDVVFLTAGADVQSDRIEIEIVGWCEGKRSYSIDYRVLHGDTAKKTTWDLLANIVEETWKRHDGTELPLKLLAVDSGFNTSHVYEFCKRYDTTRVIPVKGRADQATIVGAPRSVDTSQRGKPIGRVKNWIVGTNMVKSEIYGWLRIQADIIDGKEFYPPGYCHFPQYQQEYFRGITGEQLVFKIIKGFRKYEWVKKYERNEPLDCRVYARAAAAVVGMDRFSKAQWAELKNAYVPRGTNFVREKRKSSIWDR